ncbi:hypothetical protein BBJ28_00002567, partial [Nothophytophthora sp. Chile5]
YSGPTAAYAYHHLLDLDRIKRVFILGPSHHFYLRCRVRCGKFTTMSMDVDEDEHSIEMHLPFIFKVGTVRSEARSLPPAFTCDRHWILTRGSSFCR